MLEGKTVIEYPTFIVSTADRMCRLNRYVSTIVVETVLDRESQAPSELEVVSVDVANRSNKHSLELETSDRPGDQLVVGDNYSDYSTSPAKRIRMDNLQLNSTRSRDKNSFFGNDIQS